MLGIRYYFKYLVDCFFYCLRKVDLVRFFFEFWRINYEFRFGVKGKYDIVWLSFIGGFFRVIWFFFVLKR